jgi:FMN reductase
MKLAIIVGAATPPGRLNNAAEHVAAALGEAPGIDTEIINLASAGVEICDGRPLDKHGIATQRAVSAVIEAAAVLIASPVYRASFPGVLKNLLDILPVEALRDKPVGIVAMGGSPHHYLAVDGHLRLVLAWFGALVMPTSVYLTGRDFADGKLTSAEAAGDLEALGKSMLSVAESLNGRTLGPAPLAARFS